MMAGVSYGCHHCCSGLLTLLQSLVVSVYVPVVVVVGVVGNRWWLVSFGSQRQISCVSKTKKIVWFQAHVIPILN
jgi:hypothetical protein